MTRGPQRGETEPVEVEFETEEVPQVIFIGVCTQTNEVLAAIWTYC